LPFSHQHFLTAELAILMEKEETTVKTFHLFTQKDRNIPFLDENVLNT